MNNNKTNLTLYIGSIPGVLPHSQASTLCGWCSLLKKVLHTFIVDFQIAGTKTQRAKSDPRFPTRPQLQKFMKGFYCSMNGTAPNVNKTSHRWLCALKKKRFITPNDCSFIVLRVSSMHKQTYAK